MKEISVRTKGHKSFWDLADSIEYISFDGKHLMVIYIMYIMGRNGKRIEKTIECEEFEIREVM